jgi:undecaprenyl-diphosphatase
MLTSIKQWDTSLFLYLNGVHNATWDPVMSFMSLIPVWFPLYIVLILYIIKKFRREAWLILLFATILILLSDQTSVQLFKHLVERLRPCHDPIIAAKVHLVNNQCGGLYGFVSSHAANTFAVTVFTGKLFANRSYTVLMVLWASIISYSRIYLGVHYPLDVLCGALLGISIGYLTFWAYQLTSSRLQHKQFLS